MSKIPDLPIQNSANKQDLVSVQGTTLEGTSPEGSKAFKLYIGTPAYGGQIFAGYVASLLQSQAYLAKQNPPILLETCFLTNESLITRGRNTIVAKFLNDPTFTHLLFIDADISWHPTTIQKLVAADKDIIGACYPKKGYHWNNLDKVLPYITTVEDGKVKMKDMDSNTEAFMKANLMNYTMNYSTDRQVQNNLLNVKHIGTGFMLIKREVLEKMAAAYPETKYDDDINILSDDENRYLYALFNCENHKGSDGKIHYLSEDYLFCKRWIDMGGQIHAEVTSPLTHSGTHSFQGHYLSSLRFEGPNGPQPITMVTPQAPNTDRVLKNSDNQSSEQSQAQSSQVKPGVKVVKRINPKDISKLKTI